MNRPTKHSLFSTEQDQIFQSLLHILNIDENNNYFIRHQLDNDPHLISQVMSLTPSIRKYFASSFIPGISEPHRLHRPYLSIIKGLLKIRYNIISKETKLRSRDSNQIIRTTKYILTPKN